MTNRQTLPDLWLLSDARNDAKLESALAALPQGSGFVFRHYHLAGEARRQRYDELKTVADASGHLTVLSGDADTAHSCGAAGIYGAPEKLGRRPGLLRLATAHDAREIALANRVAVDAVFLSPVFPTRSHRGRGCLGASLFYELAARAAMPVIALGGMTAGRARELDWPKWGAIDGLT